MQINGLTTVQAEGNSGIGDILSRLAAGDMFRAKILDFIDGELLLKLFDGSVFKAEAATDIGVKTGDTLNLMVGNKEGGKLFMKIIKDNALTDALSNFTDDAQSTLKAANITGTDNETEIRLLLKKLDLPENESSIRTACNLKASGNPLTRELIQSAAGMISKFVQISASDASFLASNGISPTQENVFSILRLINGRLKLGNELDMLMQQLSKSEGELSVLAQKQESLLTKTESKVNLNGDKSLADKSSGTKSAGIISAKALSEGVTEHEPVFNNPNSTNINEAISLKAPTGTYKLNCDISADSKSAVIKNLLEALKDTIKETQDLFIKVNDTGNDKTAQKTEIKNLLANIKDKLESLDKQITILKSHAGQLKELSRDSSVGAAAANLTGILDSVQDSVRILNEVGRNTYYLQLPLNFSGNNTTAELYILKRGSKKTKLDPENTTLFISLDTINLGNVQSIIEIKGKDVAVNLRLESPEIIDFMKEKTAVLHKKLSEEGFKLSAANFRLISSTIPLSDIEKTVNEELMLRRKVMDIKI